MIVKEERIGSQRCYVRAQKVCETCGAEYTVPHYRQGKSRFCGKSCRSKWIGQQEHNKKPKPWAAKNLDGYRDRSGSRFKPGVAPWNKGLKGIHLSPDSEWTKGQRSEKRASVGAEKVRATKGGTLRAFVKVAQPNVWKARAVVVWEHDNGPLSAGMVVHHRDRNPLNDAVGNLQAMTRSEHAKEHAGEMRHAKESPRSAPVQEGFDL